MPGLPKNKDKPKTKKVKEGAISAPKIQGKLATIIEDCCAFEGSVFVSADDSTCKYLTKGQTVLVLDHVGEQAKSKNPKTWAEMNHARFDEWVKILSDSDNDVTAKVMKIRRIHLSFL